MDPEIDAETDLEPDQEMGLRQKPYRELEIPMETDSNLDPDKESDLKLDSERESELDPDSVFPMVISTPSHCESPKFCCIINCGKCLAYGIPL
jgi:hypothetical protein